MRIPKKAFLSCAVLAGLMLAAAGATADECTAGPYTVTTAGPQVVSCDGALCTEIEYTVSGNPKPDHVATVVASGSTDCATPSILSVTGDQITGNQFYSPAEGDPVTGVGKYACHEEAAKVNPADTVSKFKIKVTGARSPAPKSVVVKKGGTTRSCEIVGIGEEGAVQPAPVTETLTHGGCAVAFTLDRATGAILSAALVPAQSNKPACAQGEVGNPNCCSLLTDDVQNLNITLNGQALGDGQFGDGYIQSGTESCTTRIVGGRVYTWGSPCPQ